MISNFFTNTAVVVVVLGVMILVHELGHFVAAKYFGVRVLVFSLGFGKRLCGFKSGDTDYRVSLLPLGGYVRMAGDDPSQARQGDSGEFLSKPRGQRFVIAVMGPSMNVFMAVALLAGLYHYHFPKPAYLDQPARVGYVDPGSPAAKAGILAGDVISRLGDLANPKWEDVDTKILTAVGEALSVEVAREGQTLPLTLTPKAEGSSGAGDAGWLPYMPGLIEKIEPGFPAAKAGLMPGDVILAVEGRRVLLAPALQAGNGKELSLLVQRQGKELEVRIKPVYGSLQGDKRWVIGVLFHKDVVVLQLPWEQAIVSSLEDNLRSVQATADVLGAILTRRMSARSLSGPIGIAEISGEAYRAGIPELLMFVAFISLQLGVFNLLPIPVLDGGMILMLLVEGLIRRDLSLQVKERLIQVGVAILLLLVMVVTYFDVVKTFRPSGG